MKKLIRLFFRIIKWWEFRKDILMLHKEYNKMKKDDIENEEYNYISLLELEMIIKLFFEDEARYDVLGFLHNGKKTELILGDRFSIMYHKKQKEE